MKISITVECGNEKEAQAILSKLGSAPATFKKAAPVEEEETEETEEEETEEEEASEEPTRADVIAALQAYAEANSRPKAMKILSKFKVKSVKDLKKSDYAKVIEALEI